MRISGKVRTVHLVTLVPLAALLVAVLLGWYVAQINLIEQDRLNNAHLVATAFQTSMTDLAGASRTVGTSTLHSSASTATIVESLRQLTVSFPISWAVTADTSGRVVHASDSRLIGRTIEDTAVALAASGDRVALGVCRKYDGITGFVMAGPVFDDNGRVRTIDIEYVDSAALGRRLTQADISGGANIVDSAGQVVVLFDRLDYSEDIPDWSGYEMVQTALAGEEAVDRNWTYPLTGERRIVAEVPVRPFGWATGSGVDYRPAMSAFMRSLTVSVLLGLVVLAVSSGVVATLSRSLAGSVDALTVQAEQVGRRETSPPIVSSGDEIETVSRVLANTGEQLGLYISGLVGLGETGHMLTRALSQPDVADAVAQGAVRLFGARAVWVFLYNPAIELLEIAVWHSDRGAEQPNVAVRPGEGATGRVFAENTLVIVRDAVALDEPVWRSIAEEHDLPGFVQIPLEVGGSPFGVLGLFAPGVELWQSDQREVGLLRAYGAQAAAALENARLYEDQRIVADTLQQALLTVPARVTGIDFAHSYRSASQIARVGGDFYDLFELENERLCVLIGDVAGKGLDAAVLTSLVKTSVHAHASEQDKSPSEIAGLINTLVYRETPTESFVTLFLAYLEPDGRLTYCNAGHTTAALIGLSSVRWLPSNSALVGALPVFEYCDDVVELGSEDLLLLYTDGLIEARGADGLYGETRLFELAERLKGATPREVADTALADVLSFTGGTLTDDLAILALRRRQRG